MKKLKPVHYLLCIILVFSVDCVSSCLHPNTQEEPNKINSSIHPVIFVPGDGGSQILAKLNKTSRVHYICRRTTDYWFYLWLDWRQLMPIEISCWVDNMRLVYNNLTRTTRNNQGVHLKIPDFGNTTAVEYLDADRSYLYFGRIVDSLLDMGYERKKSVFGAPYDFRKAPNEQHEWFKMFKELITSAYNTNGMKPVVLVSHSMGSPMVLYFLTHYVKLQFD